MSNNAVCTQFATIGNAESEDELRVAGEDICAGQSIFDVSLYSVLIFGYIELENEGRVDYRCSTRMKTERSDTKLSIEWTYPDLGRYPLSLKRPGQMSI